MRGGTERVSRAWAKRTALLLLPLMVGCRSWQATPFEQAYPSGSERPERVRLLLADSSVVVLERPVLSADSIRGFTEGGRNVSAATGDLQSFEVQRFSIVKSIAAVLAHVSTIVSVVTVIIDVQPHYRGT